MTTIRVFGPPGTGKTYTLNRIVYHLTGVENNSAFLEGLGLELPYKTYRMPEIAYISFMNSAVDELLNRLDVRRNYRSGPWGTLHGLALHLLIRHGVVPKEMVGKTLGGKGGLYYWRRKFAYTNGLAYDPSEEVKALPGNQLFDGLSYAVNVYYPQYNDIGRVLDQFSLTNPELAPYAEEWLKFKRRESIIDFDDILVLAYHAKPHLDAKVLIVDEFQDFGPLQYEIFKNWADGKDYVIVSGDDDQVVSQYNGSDPRFLVELPGVGSDEDTVLKHSFRIPRVVWEGAKLFIESYVRYRYPKEFLPREEVGMFLQMRLGYYHVPELAMKFARQGRSVLILARTNSLVRDIEQLLLTQGIEYYRYKSRVTQVWRDFINRILDVVDAVRKGKGVSEADLRFFFRFTRLPEEKIRVLAKAFAKGHVPLDAYRLFDDPVKLIDPAKVADFLGTQEKVEMALTALKNILSGKVTRPRGHITVETIHASKGREADVVILLDTITPRIYSEITANQGDFEAEMRVWYVAMTRARHVLITVPVDLPLAVPLLRKAGFEKVKVVSA